MSRRPESNELYLDVRAPFDCIWGFCCDQPEKGREELPLIDCECAFCVGQKASSLRPSEANVIADVLPLSPMATLLSAQMAQRSKKVLGTGHG